MADAERPLLLQQRFGPFFLTQFFGAFNDNIFKNALILFITYGAIHYSSEQINVLVNVCAGLFILPFFLFSATAGQLADKIEKSRLIRNIKLLEIFIMVAACIGFYLQSVPLLISLLFLMGTQSAFFGPVKYSILPQHLETLELTSGNGLVEMGTFLAILIGTIAGGLLINMAHGTWIVGSVVITVAILGWLMSRFIPQAPAPEPELKIHYNPITETWKILKFAKENRTVFLSILGISWFWFYGALYLTQLPNFSKIYLQGDEYMVTLLLTLFSIGVGVGSLLCETLSGDRLEIGLVPFGSIGLTLFGLDLYFAQQGMASGALVSVSEFLSMPHNWRIVMDILGLGLFGGFYIVPLYVLIQHRSNPAHRSRIIAANNILNALFMVGAAVLAILLLHLGFTIPQLFLTTALLNALVAVYIYTLIPEFLSRFVAWMIINTLYRVKLKGMQSIPHKGGALIVCNHVSFLDALVISAGCRRPIRFVMDISVYRFPLLHFVFKQNKAIAIAPEKDVPGLKDKAFDLIAQALEDGELVGIFPEGVITRDGDINEFKRGVEHIIRRTPVPVIPLALQGLWGSFFSRRYGPAMCQIPRRLFRKIGLVAGPAIPPEDVTAAHLQEVVSELRGNWR